MCHGEHHRSLTKLTPCHTYVDLTPQGSENSLTFIFSFLERVCDLHEHTSTQLIHKFIQADSVHLKVPFLFFFFTVIVFKCLLLSNIRIHFTYSLEIPPIYKGVFLLAYSFRGPPLS